MKFKNETQLYRLLQKKLRSGNFEFQRIETSTGTGIPDVNIACKGSGKENWVELKLIHNLKLNPETKINIGLKKSQASWLASRHYYTKRAYILVGTQVGLLYLINGDESRLFLKPVTYSFLQKHSLEILCSSDFGYLFR